MKKIKIKKVHVKKAERIMDKFDAEILPHLVSNDVLEEIRVKRQLLDVITDSNKE